MVCEKLHIICGNCGQDLTEPNMAHWCFATDLNDVYITCDNCATIHPISKYMTQEDYEV